MLLYQFKKGTNPRRVIVYLSEKGIDVPRYELDFESNEHKSPEYLALNPAGRAPTLMTDEGVAITDSAAIIEYLEELHPDRPMIGADPVSRARVRAAERMAAEVVMRGQIWLWNRTNAFPSKEPAPSSAAADQVERYLEELLDVFEVAIGDNAFLTGPSPTIADCSLFAIFQASRERFDLPLGATHVRLNAWYENIRKRPSGDY